MEYLLPERIAVPETADSELMRRACPEPEHSYRSPFVRDRGRILHARAFRRLAGKTQVFTRYAAAQANEPIELGDHLRSRLTHTLEVTQIARTAAEALGLNVNLAEALAMVHDIGHPPFGHAGEKALDRCLSEHGMRFDHNLHALRIVTSFEERYAGFRGLNLTLAVREGIIKHSRDYSPAEYPGLSEYFLDRKPPLEAQLIDLADEIAYLTADIEDGLRSGILSLEQVRSGVHLFAAHFTWMAEKYPQAKQRVLVDEALRHMLNELVTSMIVETRRQVLEVGAETLEDIRNAPHRLVALAPEVEALRAEAKKFLYAKLYLSDELEKVHRHADDVVEGLFRAYMSEPMLMPEDHQRRAVEEGVPRAVADYIAGMTDSYIEHASGDCRRWNERHQHVLGFVQPPQ